MVTPIFNVISLEIFKKEIQFSFPRGASSIFLEGENLLTILGKRENMQMIIKYLLTGLRSIESA